MTPILSAALLFPPGMLFPGHSLAAILAAWAAACSSQGACALGTTSIVNPSSSITRKACSRLTPLPFSSLDSMPMETPQCLAAWCTLGLADRPTGFGSLLAGNFEKGAYLP